MRLSPPELSYLYTSLTTSPPLRPDLRTQTQYRPYSIQSDFIASANGSARVSWGTGRQGGDVLVVIKAQIGDAVPLSNGVYGGKVSIDVDGWEEEDTSFVVESLLAVICPRQYSSSYGIDVRSLAITDTKAWHVFIDCVILSSDVALPLDALSLAVRIALQTTLLPHITMEDVPTDRTYEERASLMDMSKGRVPHDQRVFQVDDDWDNAVPLIPAKDHWRIPVIITANIVEQTIFFDALPSEIQVCTNRYAIATVPLNSVSSKRKLVFCESVGESDGYVAAGRGIRVEEIQAAVSAAMTVGKDLVEAADMQIQSLRER